MENLTFLKIRVREVWKRNYEAEEIYEKSVLKYSKNPTIQNKQDLENAKMARYKLGDAVIGAESKLTEAGFDIVEDRISSGEDD